jgi:hypothetical protein
MKKDKPKPRKGKGTWTRNTEAAREKALEHLTEDVTRVNIMLYKSQNDWLESYASKNQTTKSELIRQAISLLQAHQQIARKQNIATDSMLEKM